MLNILNASPLRWSLKPYPILFLCLQFWFLFKYKRNCDYIRIPTKSLMSNELHSVIFWFEFLSKCVYWKFAVDLDDKTKGEERNYSRRCQLILSLITSSNTLLGCSIEVDLHWVLYILFHSRSDHRHKHSSSRPSSSSSQLSSWFSYSLNHPLRSKIQVLQ